MTSPLIDRALRLVTGSYWIWTTIIGFSSQRLAIIRYNYVFVEYVRGLSKRQIIGHLVEIPTIFPLLHPDTLEKEGLACHLHNHGCHIPVAWDNFCLPNFKVAALLQ